MSHYRLAAACILATASSSRLTSIIYPNGFTLRYFDLDTLTAPGLGKGRRTADPAWDVPVMGGAVSG